MVNKKSRFTPEQDYDRLAERINNQFAHNISDQDSFDKAFRSYLTGIEADNKLLTDRSLMIKTFAALRKNRPDLPDLSTFEKAGGKDYQKDVQTTAKTVVKTKEEYIRKGAQKTDLQGLDTKKQAFVLLGNIKGKVVRARRTFHVQNNRRVTVHRDSRGRFVKVRS